MVSSVWNKLSWLVPIVPTVTFRIAQTVVRLGTVVVTMSTEVALDGYSIKLAVSASYVLDVETKVMCL